MHLMAGAISALGVTVLTGLAHAPTAQSRQLALVTPPWSQDGLRLAAASGLAILDTHWHHHVIILDTGGDPAALARLDAQGLWLLDASGAWLCGTDTEGS